MQIHLELLCQILVASQNIHGILHPRRPTKHLHCVRHALCFLFRVLHPTHPFCNDYVTALGVIVDYRGGVLVGKFVVKEL